MNKIIALPSNTPITNRRKRKGEKNPLGMSDGNRKA
jgi:hypothetical protein